MVGPRRSRPRGSNYIRSGFPELGARCRTLHSGTYLELLPPCRESPPRLRRLPSELRVRFRLSGGSVVLYVRGFAVAKGTIYVLRAFRRVLEEVPDTTLALVGAHKGYFQVRSPRDRRARAELRRTQRAHLHEGERLARCLHDRVVVICRAQHDEMAASYALADVYRLPSTGAEPSSLTVPEAMGCALPFVGTAPGGTLEVIEHGVTGLLVSPGDEVDLADAPVRLCLDRPLATAMGARARALVSERFTWQTQAAQLAMYYDELVGIHPCRS